MALHVTSHIKLCEWVLKELHCMPFYFCDLPGRRSTSKCTNHCQSHAWDPILDPRTMRFQVCFHNIIQIRPWLKYIYPIKIVVVTYLYETTPSVDCICIINWSRLEVVMHTPKLIGRGYGFQDTNWLWRIIQQLSLHPLETLSSFRFSRLLPFHNARVPCQHTSCYTSMGCGQTCFSQSDSYILQSIWPLKDSCETTATAHKVPIPIPSYQEEGLDCCLQIAFKKPECHLTRNLWLPSCMAKASTTAQWLPCFCCVKSSIKW